MAVAAFLMQVSRWFMSGQGLDRAVILRAYAAALRELRVESVGKARR